MNISEIFPCFQGEINVGKYSILIRLGQCNLRCSYCDSVYSYDEHTKIDIKEIVEQSKYFPNVIISGGEPFVQKNDVASLIKKLQKENPDITIGVETNGTIRPTGLASINKVTFNVSPKLKNSGIGYEKRIKPAVLAWFNDVNANFKFVVSTKDDVDEVVMLINDLGIKRRNVYLMPEGKTRDVQLDRMLDVVKWAQENKLNFSPRMHVLLFDDKRGV